MADDSNGAAGQAAPDGPVDEVSGVEAAIVGQSRLEVDAGVSRALESLTGDRVGRVLFRAGRIDAVYALVTEGGAEVLLKVHRPPVDVPGRRVVGRA